MAKESVILGIDPGTNITGYGLIQVSGTKLSLLDLGIFDMQKMSTQAEKLQHIFSRTLSLVDTFKPTHFAIEEPFYGKNVQSMLKLGRAQGVALAAALYRNLPVHEYTPRKVKQSVCGNGNSSKEQVAAMVATLLNIRIEAKKLDATDALAIAICHYFQGLDKPLMQGTNYSGWDAFIKANPGRKA